MPIAVDRATKFAFVEPHEKATRSIVGDFLHALIEEVPYRTYTVLDDNHTYFTSPENTRLATAEIRLAVHNHKQSCAHALDALDASGGDVQAREHG